MMEAKMALGILVVILLFIVIVWAGRKDAVNLKKKKLEREAHPENWFSWGVLIFWIVVCFPIAIIYILIKMGDRRASL